MKRLCECGCGQEVKAGNRFVHGHNDKKCWNKGKTGVYSEETLKKRSGENNGMWKDGITLRRIYCKTCGKSLTNYRSEYCQRCCLLGSKNHRYGIHEYGKEASNWQGGISFEPYPPSFNQQLKDRIRVRDNFICQKCGVPELECDRRLDIHHIDYDKNNCKDDNLLSLCHKCNTNVNANREYWTNYFQCLLQGRSKWIL